MEILYDGKVSNTYARLEIDYIRTNTKPAMPASLSPNSVENIIFTDEDNVFSFYYTDTNNDPLNAYEIQYRQQGTSTWTTIGPIGKSQEVDTTVSHTFEPGTFSNDTTYEWQVRVYDGALWSDWSSISLFETNTKPDAPTSLHPNTTTEVIDATIANNLSFLYSDPNLNDMTQYEIRYRAQGSTEWGMPVSVVQTLANGVTAIHTVYAGTLASNTIYEWQVRVYDGHLWSEWSQTAYIVTDSMNVPPGKPISLSPDNIDPSIHVKYDNSFRFAYFDVDMDDMTQYQIQYRIQGETLWITPTEISKIQASGTTVKHIFTGYTFQPNTSYEWQARVYDGKIWSEWSETAYFKTYYKSLVGQIHYIAVIGRDLSGMINKNYVINYNPYLYRLLDLCGMKNNPDISIGTIMETGVDITQIDEINGIIRFSVTKDINFNTAWTGLLNIVKFQSLTENNEDVSVIEE